MSQEYETTLERKLVENRSHYTYQIQQLIDLHNNGELPMVADLNVEPRYGYIATMTYQDGNRRIIYGNDPGFNLSTSERLAKDKGYTKFVLRELGVNCPLGDEFLLPWWADTLKESDRHLTNETIQATDEANEYITNTLGYPIYVKPVDGSQGTGVHKVHSSEELAIVFDQYNEERVKVAVIEEALSMPDYRLVVFDGELLAAYERRPMAVVGNGQDSIGTLLSNLEKQYALNGREVNLDKQLPRVEQYLARIGFSLSSIPIENENVTVTDVSNLSAGGSPVNVLDRIDPHWHELSARVAKGFNLRLCGVDLACEDITSAESNYSILEVNGTPGIHHFASSGDDEGQQVRAMYKSFFNAPPLQ